MICNKFEGCVFNNGIYIRNENSVYKFLHDNSFPYSTFFFFLLSAYTFGNISKQRKHVFILKTIFKVNGASINIFMRGALME